MLRLILVAFYCQLIIQHVAANCNVQVLNGLRQSLTNDCWSRSNSQCWNGNVENWACSDVVWKNCMSRWTAYLTEHCNPNGIPACRTSLQTLASTFDARYAALCAEPKPGKSGHCTYGQLFNQMFPLSQQAANDEEFCDEDICRPESEQCGERVQSLYRRRFDACQDFSGEDQSECEEVENRRRDRNLVRCNGCTTACLGATPPVWPPTNNGGECFQ
ncbi:hypothetical protein F5H01DRAFT_353603 [Linnemannia elongata]|nr:hypothetical protein F5H01DRAFT_353603 [Linnemannia elongata]